MQANFFRCRGSFAARGLFFFVGSGSQWARVFRVVAFSVEPLSGHLWVCGSKHGN